MTSAGKPDKPQPPRLQHQNRNQLNLKWTPPNDNGDKIKEYSLQYKTNHNWKCIYKGLQRVC